MQARVVNVTFYNQPKNYTFSAEDVDVKIGDRVVARTSKGILLGKATTGVMEKDIENTDGLMPVLRVATKFDEKKFVELEKKSEEIKEELSAMTKANGWKFKVQGIEISLDDKFMVVNFTAEDYVDFRDISKIISGKFGYRVELRQLGERDDVKLLGGLGVCGKECCCKEYLQEFGKLSLKMAKNQGLSLSPQKTNGLCGRLLCCLAYENEYYIEAQKIMPKVGMMVQTPKGEGKVVFNNLITKRSNVMFDAGEGKKKTYEDFDVSELIFTPVGAGNDNGGNEKCCKKCENKHD